MPTARPLLPIWSRQGHGTGASRSCVDRKGYGPVGYNARNDEIRDNVTRRRIRSYIARYCCFRADDGFAAGSALIAAGHISILANNSIAWFAKKSAGRWPGAPSIWGKFMKKLILLIGSASPNAN
jgi:hypothetical protein